MKPWLWDYKLPKNWKPKDDYEWIWYLERKINYGDFTNLKAAVIKKYLDKLKLDKGKYLMLKTYFKKYAPK